MATVIDTPDPAPKFATKVDEQIAEAAGRVRGHDLALGGLLVAGLTLGYAAAIMLLDRYLVLPELVRQLALIAFLGAVGFTAYRTLVRPLRSRVNPLYAAVLVERTIDDAKNSVVGYVEARERGDVHPTVKAAMGARAAKTVDEADVNQAVDHRGLLHAGGVVVALFLTLVVLFFVFRPTQFQSLLGRAFAPFSAGSIAKRTQIALVEPQPGDVTVTSGQSLLVKVEVTGTIPKPDRPDRVRLLVRYNPATPEYDEIPLEPGETSREWSVQVRPEQLRTGAWYRVAAGDNQTDEYRVTVRTAPLFTDFEVGYEFPAYTRRPPEQSTDPHLHAIRNTKVSVVAKANRPVRDGRAVFDPPGQAPVSGKPVHGRPDALRFDFPLTTPGSYRLTFTAADGERSPDSLPFGIKIDEDLPPQVVVTSPEPDDIQLSANGLLAVNGAAGDDHGLDKLTLRLKLIEPADKARLLAAKQYLGGKSFRREADGTYPQSLEYKDSVEFGKLADAAGAKVELKAGDVIEYWLEATDNRTKPGPTGPEPDPQVGKSAAKRVRLTPPVEAKEDREQQDARREQRKQEEQKHAQDQQQKLDNEPRPQPNQNQKQDNPPQGNPQQKEGDPMMPPQGQPDMGKNGKNGDPMMPPDMGKMPPEKGMNDGMGNPPPKGENPKTPMDKGNAGQGDPKMPPEKGNTGDPMTPQGKNTDPMPNPMGGMGDMNKQDTKQGNMWMPMGSPMSDGMGQNGMPQQAPMPSDPSRKDIQKKADQIQEQLNQEKNGGGDPKSAPTANPEERANPADQKGNPPPMDGMRPDSTPKGNEGGMGASEQRPEGNVRPPEGPATPKPEPKSDPMANKGGKDQPSEKRSEPLGGEPGMERDTPKGGPQPMGSDPMMTKGMPPENDPMNKGGMGQPKTDPGAGGEPKPSTQQKGGGEPMADPMAGKNTPEPNPAENAGRAKTAPPTNDRGQERPQTGDPKGGMGQQQPDARPQDGGEPKPDRPQEPGQVRPMPKSGDPMNQEGNKGSDPKAGDPMAKAGDPMANAAEPRPGPMGKTGEPMGNGKEPEPKGNNTKGGDPKAGMGQPQPKGVEPGSERPMPGEPQPSGARPEAPMPKSADPMGGTGKQGDPKAGPEAGPMNPMSKGMGDDPMGMGQKGGPVPKLDAKQKAELEQAAKDLTSPDQAKRKDARDKLDRALGKEKRREIEDVANGLNSDDPAERQRAQQKLDDLRRRAEQMAGKEPEPKGGNPMPMPKGMNDPTGGGMNPKEGPTPKGMDDPMGGMNPKGGPMAKGMNEPGGMNPKGGPTPKIDPKELEQDLKNLGSKDEAKRQEARDKLDKTVGEQARRQAEQLQNDLNSNDPERQAKAKERLEELRRQAEQMAKNNPPGKGDGRGEDERFGQGGSVAPKNGPPLADDPRNRAKSAELTLEQFEKNRFNRDLQEKLGWSQDEYDRFLEDYRREVERLRRDAEAEPGPPAPGPTIRPTDINAGGKVEGNPNAGPGGARVGGPAYAAPGYGDALRRFQQGATQRGAPKKP